MRLLAPSVRTRLTLWHAGVLALVICMFSAGILLFVRARLYSALDQQVSHDLATIEKVYHEETGDLGELAHRMGITHFQVVEGGTVLYQTPGWPPVGTTPYRLGTLGDVSHRITAARDETALRQTLWTLGVILAMGVPWPSVWRSGAATFSRAECSHPSVPWRRRRARSRQSH